MWRMCSRGRAPVSSFVLAIFLVPREEAAVILLLLGSEVPTESCDMCVAEIDQGSIRHLSLMPFDPALVH